MMTAVGEDRKQEVEVLDRKIAIATEGFTTNKFCELVLKDRNRLSIENTLIGMTSIPVRVNLTSVAGINAWSVDHIFTAEDKQTFFRETYMVNNGKLYKFTYLSPPLKVPATLPIAQKMIDSFQFIE
ncbi:MAG: hypothetical protein ACJ71K_19465 [Nitrososphaeraceae archaeon]|jgi:hypothetical protein